MNKLFPASASGSVQFLLKSVIICYMKAGMIAIFLGCLGLFGYLLVNYDSKLAWLWCGLVLLTAIIAISYALILGYYEDKKKNKLIDQQIYQDIQCIVPGIKTDPKKYSWHQRIVCWLYKKDKLS